jgi:MinD-like ATPase involved in chromosome partitioning or flagellar assembly
VTTNDDTPQVFGEDAHDDAFFGEDEPYFRPGLAPFSSPGAPEAVPFPSRDDQAFPATTRWVGWSDRVEPLAPGDDHPRPSFHPREPEFDRDTGYASHLEYVDDLGYPGYPRAVGRASGVGYASDADYAPDVDYAADPGFAHDAGPVPLMEPLPDLEEQSVAVLPAPTMAPPATPPPTGTAPPAAAEARGFRDEMLAPLPPDYPPETSDSLTSESLLHGKRAAPASGWRRGVYRATGGLLRFGESAAEMRRRDLINRVRTPVAGGHHRVAVLSLKGGVGKTTTAVGLGATLATLRGDRVIAVDANPDRGTLSDKVRLETAATVRDLLNERDQVRRYADVRAFTSQAPSRLEVLASDRDPGVSVAFGADDYCDAARVLEHFYSICITDCGTGLLHSAMSGVLQLADQIVLVSSPSVDGARSASATLDWLEAHYCGDLVRNGVVVLSAIRPKSKSTVDLDRLEHHFAARCRAVVRIPYDPHLEEGAEIELELLGSDTADSYLALAAIVGDGLAWPRRLTSHQALP